MDALQQLNIAAPVADIFGKLEYDIIVAIARQLSKNPDKLINHTSEWRIQMLARMGKVSKETARYIAQQTKDVPGDVEAIINEVVTAVLDEHGLAGNDKVIENLSKALEMFDHQAVKDKYNQVNTVMQYKARKAYVGGVNSVADRFEKGQIANKQEHLDILNKNALEVTLGEKSRTEAVRDTIREMSDKGIPAFVDASGREWSPEAYVSMDIRNTAKNAALMSEFEATKELGQDVILVSSHAAARPLCAPYQGKFYSLSGKAGTITDAYGKEYTYEPLSSTSYGEPAGLFGINCGHTFRGVEDGLFVNNEETYSEKENSEEYEKVQKQRRMEREIRKNKMKRDALRAAGEEEGAKEYDRKVREGNKRLNEYCAENGLTIRQDRTQVYGYSEPNLKQKPKDIVKTVDNFGKSGIMESETYHAGIKDSIARLKSKPNSNVKYEEAAAEYLDSLPKLSKPESIQQALKATNPSGNDENCQRCVPAYIMRRRGYNVTASLPPKNLLTDSLGFEDYKKVFIDSDWKTSSGSGLEEITEFLRQSGHGTAVEISIYTQRSAHLFVGENENGVIRFVDPQVDDDNVTRYFNSAITGMTEYARIDNLMVSNLIKECLEV